MQESEILKMDNTLNYYNENAQKFIESTVSVEFKHMQDKFLDKLGNKAYILDFGCGSGRDTKYFLDKGYRVDAIDGSKELCKFASEFTGIEVKNILFQELHEYNKYDGIWACSSILHCTRKELPLIFKKMIDALTDKGVIYTSFKYGDFEGERNGRFFNFMTEKTLDELLLQFPELEKEELWVTEDVRPNRDSEKWLNVILRKR